MPLTWYPDALIRAVDIIIKSRSGDRVSETCSFRKIGDDFMTLDTGVVIFVDEKGFDDNKNVRPDEIAESAWSMP